MFRSIRYFRPILTATRAMQTSAPMFEANATHSSSSPATGHTHQRHFDSLRAFVTQQYARDEKPLHATSPLELQPTAASTIEHYVLCEDDVILMSDD